MEESRRRDKLDDALLFLMGSLGVKVLETGQIITVWKNMWWHWAPQFPGQIQSFGGRPAAAISWACFLTGCWKSTGHLTLDGYASHFCHQLTFFLADEIVNFVSAKSLALTQHGHDKMSTLRETNTFSFSTPDSVV